MSKLIIQHVEGSIPTRFQVIRGSDSKAAGATVVVSVEGFPVAGSPQSDLRGELRWYLEEFLEYPYPPLTDRADAVKASLRDWGEQAFLALFDNLDAGGFLHEAIGKQLSQLRLEIVSDDPRVLAWPWEALYDPQRQTLAHHCQMIRRLNKVADPPAMPAELPRGQINILLVTARPFDEDVKLRSISRLLVELIAKERLPARVTVLRPPTFDGLCRHLSDSPDRYHIVHFDGHGAYMDTSTRAPHAFAGIQGQLAFEDNNGHCDLIAADKLSLLLAEYRIPAVVLNACQSGMIDAKAEDAFASVAAALLRAGVRSVVAMAYSVYVSAAQEFLPAFYRELFRSGSFAEATRAGRRQLLASQARTSPRGRFDLDDWVVPVVYEEQPLDLSFIRQAEAPPEIEFPEDVADRSNPHGFIGRDGELLQLERALHAAPAGILICGLGGVGKTTLAMGFARWLIETGGIDPNRVFWFRFDESLRSAEYIINQLGQVFFGTQFVTKDLNERMNSLARALKDRRSLIVWDNFEVARGIEGTSVQATLARKDQNLLKQFLASLRGGTTKVIITSRGEEEWLEPTNRQRINLGGLIGEERWEYCDAIIGDLARKPDRDDPSLMDLMNRLDGHPLAMRVVLTQLENRSPAEVAGKLAENIASFAGGNHAERQLFGALQIVEDALPAELRKLLVPLALHDRYADASLLETMARQVDEKWSRADIDRFVGSLCLAGLLRHVGHAVFEMHPLLPRYLAQRTQRGDAQDEDAWTRAFVDTMAQLADSFARRPLHEQRGAFFFHCGDFHRARIEAQRMEIKLLYTGLTQSLAAHARNTGNLDIAERLLLDLCDHCRKCDYEVFEAAAYHSLGMVAQRRRQFEQAQAWYEKSLDIFEQLNDAEGIAVTYHQLGTIAESRRQFEHAVEWYQKSLVIDDRLGNDGSKAGTYHHLASVAIARGQLDNAQVWCEKSLLIKEKLRDEGGVATTYHLLGMIAEDRKQLEQAEDWYKKAATINERIGVSLGAAMAYHHLGNLADERRDYDQAEAWYKKALRMTEREGAEHEAGFTYHQLGTVAQHRRQFEQAEEWYKKALEIAERQENGHAVASNYYQLGSVAEKRASHDEAIGFLIRAGRGFAMCSDSWNYTATLVTYVRVAQQQLKTSDRAKLALRWIEAGLPKIPDRIFQEMSKGK